MKEETSSLTALERNLDGARVVHPLSVGWQAGSYVAAVVSFA